MQYCFGVDVGGTTVKLGLFQTDGVLVSKWEIPTRKECKEDVILPDIAASIKEEMANRGIEKEQVVGIGVGVPAAVTNDGYVDKVANLGWGQKHVRLELEALTGCVVVVENDANVAALGEMWQGGGVGYNNLVMVTLGTGVGGGIIVNGQILSGVNGGAGEIGHLFVVLFSDFCSHNFAACRFRKLFYKLYNSWIFVRSSCVFNMSLKLFDKLF